MPTKRLTVTDYSEDEVGELVDEIENLVFFERGGMKTDWSNYPFEYYKLFCVWKDAEKEFSIQQSADLQAAIESLFR